MKVHTVVGSIARHPSRSLVWLNYLSFREPSPVGVWSTAGGLCMPPFVSGLVLDLLSTSFLCRLVAELLVEEPVAGLVLPRSWFVHLDGLDHSYLDVAQVVLVAIHLVRGHLPGSGLAHLPVDEPMCMCRGACISGTLACPCCVLLASLRSVWYPLKAC